MERTRNHLSLLKYENHPNAKVVVKGEIGYQVYGLLCPEASTDECVHRYQPARKRSHPDTSAHRHSRQCASPADEHNSITGDVTSSHVVSEHTDYNYISCSLIN